MAGYTRNIAVIKGIKSGFSADGGRLSGLVKTEQYGTRLRADITLINFAPLAEGHYVIALSDGAGEVVFGSEGYEGECDVDISCGFAAAVCFVLKGEVNHIATAVCGDMEYAADFARRAVEAEERAYVSSTETAYDDEAIAEGNYYERDEDGGSGESGGCLRKDEAEKEEEICGSEDEAYCGVCKEPQDKEQCGEGEAIEIPLAAADGFYRTVQGEIERIFGTYPQEEELERVVEDSRWAKITYGGGKHYVFGVIYAEGKPAYLCYGVPSKNAKTPPDSLKGMAGYIPISGGGYWVMYQDAATGISIKIDDI
ncbi:MAG: hypothetical protein LUD19_05530 [Clostridia bacterium]|nr:hypothetical protein [Clostridia bacterium]